MRYVLIAVEAFASIMLFIIMIASLSGIKQKGRRDRAFAWFVVMNFALCLSDMLSWIVEGRRELMLLNYVFTYMTICGAHPAVCMFVRYLLTNVDDKRSVARWKIMAVDIYTCAMTVATLVLCATGHIFTLKDAHYETLEMYPYYMFSVFVMYMFVLVLALSSFRAEHRYELVSFSAYSLSPFLALIVEALVPELSLSYAATSVSILIIYILLQSTFRINAQERERLLIERGKTDDMTGVMNRRAYSETLENTQAGQMLGVAFCDVNGLKYFNDTYGHKAGDRMILSFTGRLLESFNRTEIYRISGDEFVIICKEISQQEFEGKVARADRVEEGSDYHLAAVGQAYGDSSMLENLLRQAEESMYVQKTIFHRQFPRYIRKGSLFTRYISDDGAEAPQTLRSAEQADEPDATMNHEKNTLLLIDDSDQHDLLKKLLESDYNVIDIPGINEAVQALEARAREIALVLMDTDPPRINGFEFLQMKQATPGIAGIPVIVTALHSDRGTEARYLKLGAFDFIHRPYSADMLLNRLQRTIEMKESVATLNAVEKDELTQVYTRQVFDHLMCRRLEREPDTGFDLAVFDVQSFKLINEHHGEKLADSLLKSIGDFLLKEEGSDGLAGRYAGDEFMLLLPKTRTGAPDFWEMLTSSMEKACILDDIIIKCGVYVDVDHALPAASLCYRTLLALRSVKHQYGQSVALFSAELLERDTRAQQLEITMEQARDEGQFKVYYQPKCDVHTGRLVGAEALLRWVHPTFGFLPPDQFIPLFERNGFIIDTDLFVWDRTAENLKRWKDAGLLVPVVSVNASRRDFGVEGHFEHMISSLEKNGVDPGLIHIEVTESMFIEHADRLASELLAYREKGIKVELDDFGCGYSALNALGLLPIDVVKFDKKFIDLCNAPRSLMVMASAIKLVKSLNLETVVEGVETKAQHDIAESMGADLIQGYYYSKPLPEAEFEAYLKREKEKID